MKSRRLGTNVDDSLAIHFSRSTRLLASEMSFLRFAVKTFYWDYRRRRTWRTYMPFLSIKSYDVSDVIVT